jgi:hypothetical protein
LTHHKADWVSFYISAVINHNRSQHGRTSIMSRFMGRTVEICDDLPRSSS